MSREELEIPPSLWSQVLCGGALLIVFAVTLVVWVVDYVPHQ